MTSLYGVWSFLYIDLLNAVFRGAGRPDLLFCPFSDMGSEISPIKLSHEPSPIYRILVTAHHFRLRLYILIVAILGQEVMILSRKNMLNVLLLVLSTLAAIAKVAMADEVVEESETQA